MLKLASEGYPFIFTFAFVTLVTLIFKNPLLTSIPFILTLFMIYFFRDPDRKAPEKGNAFYAPADGRVILIDEADENELLNRRALKISIFMSAFNVHVNRVPCDGSVKEVRHYPGKFLPAYKNSSSLSNEHITMLLETGHGEIVLRQVAGLLARRAVCRVKPGDSLQQCQRYGIIKFSSRVDIFLPLNTRIKVKLKDKVKAGETIIGII